MVQMIFESRQSIWQRLLIRYATMPAFVALFATRDQEEGMRAFLEKREPKFEGR